MVGLNFQNPRFSTASVPTLGPYFEPFHSPAIHNELDRRLVFGRDTTPSKVHGNFASGPNQNLEANLFSNRAELKVLTSQVSMHLAEKQRIDLFRQIDELLDKENWTEDDRTINSKSYKTFLRFMTYFRR